MCGIYGYLSFNEQINTNEKDIFDKLSSLSEIRGREACGVALQYDNQQIIDKYVSSSSIVYKDKNFKNKIDKFYNFQSQKLLLGHSRLQTHGDRNDNNNNQPVYSEGRILLHNGIVCNYEEIFNENNLNKYSELDSEAILQLYNHLIKENDNEVVVKKIFSEIIGEASIAILDSNYLNLATNSGSLYYIFFEDTFEVIFASEKVFLQELRPTLDFKNINHLEPGTALSFNLINKDLDKFNVPLSRKGKEYFLPLIKDIKLNSPSYWESKNTQICKKGILNSNMPGISFDKSGISNFSKNFIKLEKQPLVKLENTLNLHRSSTQKQDIIVGFSGGRDSSYMLHLLKNKYEMNPIAVTYDWGMVTDLARRNQARICGMLGIEHVIVAADIPEKRNYIKNYVSGWLQKPHLGMVPLFMAGDKQYFQVLNDTAKKNNINLISFGASPYEFTTFKTGFAGVVDSSESRVKLDNLLQASEKLSKIKLSLFYLKQVLSNSKYWNKSILDALFGFKYSYFEKKDYLQIFEYEEWEEDQINDILIKDYGWETDPTIPSSWRIGDGTAPFYNYIYRAFVGFSEHDTFRNNQVLSGVLDRETALSIVERENEPRFEKIREYLELIDLDYEQTIQRIMDLSHYEN